MAAARRITLLLAALVLPLFAVRASAAAPAPTYGYHHVVVVVLENHASGQIMGSTQAPYLNALAKQGLVLTDSHGETHPSEPNYLAIFAGQTFGVTSDACPLRLSAPNLASELRSAHLSFATYSESQIGRAHV